MLLAGSACLGWSGPACSVPGDGEVSPLACSGGETDLFFLRIISSKLTFQFSCHVDDEEHEAEIDESDNGEVLEVDDSSCSREAALLTWDTRGLWGRDWNLANCDGEN